MNNGSELDKYVVDDIANVDNINILFNNKVYIYGTGIAGIDTYKTLTSAGVPVAGFCDSNPAKWGRVTEGYSVLPPEELKLRDTNETITIIIATENVKWVDEILDTIRVLKLQTGAILSYLGLKILILQNINDERLNSKFCSFFYWNAQRKKKEGELIVVGRQIELAHSYLANPTPLLIYSCPKVGTMTIRDSIINAGAVCHKLHSFNAIASVYKKYQGPQNDLEQVFSGENLDKLKYIDNLKIITLVREPLSREYSNLYQCMGIYGPAIITSKKAGGIVRACESWLTDRVAEYGNVPNMLETIEQFFWFEHELKHVFGIDVLNYNFDKEKGFSIIRQGKVELLIIKLEKLNLHESVIREFTGISHFKIANSNESGDRLSKYLYNNARKVMKFPKDMVSHYYCNNQYMDYFYTEKEKRAFLDKWKNNI